MAVSTVVGNEAQVATKAYTLNTTHRCDRCGAQAYVEVFLKSGTAGKRDLLFCGHHYDRVAAAIAPIMASHNDERQRLVENRAKGSEN